VGRRRETPRFAFMHKQAEEERKWWWHASDDTGLT
jgi:hypothetical protein